MDKRSILFVIFLSAALFLVSHLLGPKRDTTPLPQMETEQTELQKEVAARRAAISSLPLTEIFSDERADDPVSIAIKSNDQYLFLSPLDESPEQLYLKDGTPLALRASGSKGQPVVYTENLEKDLIAAQAPGKESIDLQLVQFTPQLEGLSIILAEEDSGNIYFPLDRPENDGIVMIRTIDGYFPYAVYRVSSNSLQPLGTISALSSMIAYESRLPTYVELEGEERFYVLQNDFQQLVFSNFGGALAEINLVLKDEEHPESKVQPIGFDRLLEKDYPTNDHFPSFPYTTVDANEKTVFVEEPELGGYYPLLRRSIVGAGRTTPTYRLPPQYYAFNVISADQSTGGNAVYKLKRLEKNLIEFEGSFSNRRITKTYTFPNNSNTAPYVIDLKVRVEGDGRGLYLTTGIPEVELISNQSSPDLKYHYLKGSKWATDKIKNPKTSTTFTSANPDWISNSNGFFGIIIDPLTEAGSGFSAYKVAGNVAPTRLALVGSEYDRYPVDKYPGFEMQVPLRSGMKETTFRLYAGPYATDILKTVDTTFSNPTTGASPNYLSAQSFHGWFAFISVPFSKFLLILMQFFYSFTGSWGIAIILLTVALRIMLYPLNAWQIKSSMKMQEVAPLVSAVQKKYKSDPRRAQIETMKIYKEKGGNPFSGCIPILIQTPFLIGMFGLLRSTFELRGASFIPGWIDNLTAPDVLFSWSYPIPFIGTEFHLLPILLGITMYFQQRLSSPPPKDKSSLTDQQRQQRMMTTLMPILFTFIFYRMPSGLNLYWLSSMLLGIVQQYFMMKKRKHKPKLKIIK